MFDICIYVYIYIQLYIHKHTHAHTHMPAGHGNCRTPTAFLCPPVPWPRGPSVKRDLY